MRNTNTPNITTPVKGLSFGVDRGYTATDDLWSFVATDDLARGKSFTATDDLA